MLEQTSTQDQTHAKFATKFNDFQTLNQSAQTIMMAGQWDECLRGVLWLEERVEVSAGRVGDVPKPILAVVVGGGGLVAEQGTGAALIHWDLQGNHARN